MDTIVKIIGVVIIAFAVVSLLKPNALKSIVEFFKQGGRIYIIGLVRLALAVLFLLAARECDITWVIVVFGILFLISGLLIFMLGPKKLRTMIEWFQRQSSVLLRIIAAITLAVGLIIIYCA